MLERLVRHMVCPRCRGALETDFPARKGGGRLRFADLHCRGCRDRYAIRDGIGLFAGAQEAGGEWRPDPEAEGRRPVEEDWRLYLASLPTGVPEAYERILDRLEEDVAAASGLVLDLAVGRGLLLRRLAPRTASPQLLLGVDTDAGRLRSVQASLRHDRHYSAISLAEVDPAHLPLEDHALSAAVSFFGPLGLPRGRSVMVEMARLLRPGSLFAFSTLLTREGSLTVSLAERQDLDELLTEKRLRASLTQAGFAVESWEVMAQGAAWRRNPYDALPLEGDPYEHVLVSARRVSTPAPRGRGPRPPSKRRP